MKKILKLAFVGAIGSLLMLAGCTKDFSADIQNLDSKISTLSGKVDNLQKAIDEGSVIKSVTPSAEGITITLSDGKSYSITNGAKGDKGDTGAQGAKGDKGDAGAPGSVITIGANGNWFIDGVDTGKPSQGAQGAKGDKGDKGDTGAQGAKGDKGDKGDTGAQGAKGDKGDKGDNGADGKYYVPNTDTKTWWVYEPGKDAADTNISWLVDNVLTGVWDTDNNTLMIFNADGCEPGQPVVINLVSTLKSLAFIPETMTQGLGIITGAYNFYTADAEPVLLGIAPGKATYRVNPTNAEIPAFDAAAENWKFINRSVTTRAAIDGDSDTLVTIKGVKDNKNGSITVEFVVNDDELPEVSSEAGEYPIVALQATTANGEVITSDYSFIENGEDIDTYFIKHKKCGKVYSDEIPVADPTLAPADTCKEGENLFDISDKNYKKELKLADFVETFFTNDAGNSFELSKYGINPTYKFALADDEEGNYSVANAFVKVDTTTGVMTLKPIDNLEGDHPAIGAMPLVKVTASVDTNVIATAYIKVLITGVHTHIWALDSFKLNSNYILGSFDNLYFTTSQQDSAYIASLDKKWNEIGAVRVKGEGDEMKSAIIEHFENYYVPSIEDSIIFEIVNFPKEEVAFTSGEGSTMDYYTEYGENGIIFSADQWNAYRVDATDEHNAGYIKLIDKGKLIGDKDVMIKVTEKCSKNKTEKVGWYYVVFESQTFSTNVKAKDIDLYTFKNVEDVVMVDTLITIYDGKGSIIFNYNVEAKNWEPTEYAKKTYGDYLTDASVKVEREELDERYFTYSDKDPKDSFGGHLWVSNDDDTTESYIAWFNQGTELQTNKIAWYTFKVTVTAKGENKYIESPKATITVHSTAETRAKFGSDIKPEDN